MTARSTAILFTRFDFGLKDKVHVGQVGDMPAILDAMTRADKVMSV